jgi:hypothetical protein
MVAPNIEQVPGPSAGSGEMGFRFNFLSRLLFSLVRLSPSRSHLAWSPDVFEVCFGWAFRLSVARTSIVSVNLRQRSLLECGVHGWYDRWVVNGSYGGLVEMTFVPTQRAKIGVFSVPVRKLTISVSDPAALVNYLQPNL